MDKEPKYKVTPKMVQLYKQILAYDLTSCAACKADNLLMSRTLLALDLVIEKAACLGVEGFMMSESERAVAHSVVFAAWHLFPDDEAASLVESAARSLANILANPFKEEGDDV